MDKKALEVLRHSVSDWNMQRPGDADLAGADLSRMDLSGADLSAVDLSRATLTGSNLNEALLVGANLAEADLTRASLAGARLSQTNLVGSILNAANLASANLAAAKLNGASMNHTDLARTDLSEANLSNADLAGAYLTGTFMRKTNLNGANLTGADLTGASLVRADLSGANLSQADLRDASLNNVELSASKLDSAIFGQTVLASLDLRPALGLETVAHRGPSTIGTDTLYRSEGMLPPKFLRGCGLPREFVEGIPALTDAAQVEHCSAYISYSHHIDDAEYAEQLHHFLDSVCQIPVWLDQVKMVAGDPIMVSVDRGIRETEKTILLCSAASLDSWWVEQEIERSAAKERDLVDTTGERTSVIIPVDLDGHLFSKACDHPYASTIRRAKVVHAKDWNTSPTTIDRSFAEVQQALRRNRI